MISIAIALLLTFIGGLTIFRTTHAIWNMKSSNAISFNNTLNIVFVKNPVIEIIVCMTIIIIIACFLIGSVQGGFS